MDIDVTTYLGAVTREVQSIEYEGRPAKVVRARRVYDTTVEDLWDAITNPERLPRWFLPVSGELRLGGHYQLEGNAGGEITRCEPPRALALTWVMRGDTSWVAVALSEVPDGAQLDLQHIAHVPPEFWDQFGPGAVGVGWELGLAGLGLHLETDAPVDRQAGETWPTTEAGRRYVEAASAAWARASIADGTDPAQANAAAAATTGFYTGAGSP